MTTAKPAADKGTTTTTGSQASATAGHTGVSTDHLGSLADAAVAKVTAWLLSLIHISEPTRPY